MLDYSVDVLDWGGFNVWTIISRVWASIAATFIIVIPFVQEVSSVCLGKSILCVIFYCIIADSSHLAPAPTQSGRPRPPRLFHEQRRRCRHLIRKEFRVILHAKK